MHFTGLVTKGNDLDMIGTVVNISQDTHGHGFSSSKGIVYEKLDTGLIGIFDPVSKGYRKWKIQSEFLNPTSDKVVINFSTSEEGVILSAEKGENYSKHFSSN